MKKKQISGGFGAGGRHGGTRGFLGGLAVLSAVLAACQGPLTQDTSDQNWSRYADSVLARAIADDSLRSLPANSPTVNKGVRELARVDENAPEAPATAVTPMAEGAATNPREVIASATTQAVDTTRPATLGESEKGMTLSLEQALARALKHNLAIKVEAYTPAIREAQITEALAAFDPVFFAQSQFTNQDQPPGSLQSQTNGVNWANSVGVRKLLPSGGTAQFSAGDTYRHYTSNFFVFPNSAHLGDLNVSLTQPLLRGFGTNVTQANIYLSHRDRRIALATFRRQVITTVADVETAYLNLVLARTAVDIQERLLQSTGETFDRIKKRIDIDADRIQIKQAQAAYESRQAELVRAQAQVRNASDNLKSLLNDPELDLRTNLLLVPTDRPLDVPLTYNVANQVEMALRQRTELQEARLQIERADIIIEVAKNDLLPKLDLTFSTQSNAVDNGLDAAMVGTFNAPKYIDYAAGLRLEIPIGNRQSEAVLRRRQLERRQALTQMLRIAQQVILDVKTQLRDVLTSYQEIQAREAARKSAGEELKALLDREIVERLTPEYQRLKLDSQQRLANAELQELQALVNYNLAIMRLEQAKGTLLEYNRIAIEPAPTGEAEKGKIRFMGETYDWK